MKACVVVCAVLLLSGCADRYQVAGTGDGSAVKVDTITGKSWVLLKSTAGIWIWASIPQPEGDGKPGDYKLPAGWRKYEDARP